MIKIYNSGGIMKNEYEGTALDLMAEISQSILEIANNLNLNEKGKQIFLSTIAETITNPQVFKLSQL